MDSDMNNILTYKIDTEQPIDIKEFNSYTKYV